MTLERQRSPRERFRRRGAPTIFQSTVSRLSWTAVPTRLRHRRVEQVGADRGRRVEAEQQDEQRSHQRAAADAGHADERADEKAGERIERIVRGKDRRPLLIRSKGMKMLHFAPLERAALPKRSGLARAEISLVDNSAFICGGQHLELRAAQRQRE